MLNDHGRATDFFTAFLRNGPMTYDAASYAVETVNKERGPRKPELRSIKKYTELGFFTYNEKTRVYTLTEAGEVHARALGKTNSIRNERDKYAKKYRLTRSDLDWHEYHTGKRPKEKSLDKQTRPR